MKKLLFILMVVFFFVSNSHAQSVKLQKVVDGLTSPLTVVDPNDGSNRLFIVDQVGKIYIVDSTGKMMTNPFLDLTKKIVKLRTGYDERGVLGLAFHPNYKTNGRFYVHYSAPPTDTAYNNDYVISEFKVSTTDSNMADTSSEKILIKVLHPQLNHNSGTIMFGPKDGYLYAGIGDGGGANDTAFGHVTGGNGQDIDSNLMGSILRIDVDNGNPYGIPADNPFVNKAGMDEIYAYGFRNPYSFSFDMGGTNKLIVGDAGQDLYEEVDVVTNGGNYGWNIKEGTHCFNPLDAKNPPPTCPDSDKYGNKLIDPVIEFNNSDADSVNGQGIVVVGGYVYRGMNIPELNGRYIFGSYAYEGKKPSGRLFVAVPDSTTSDSMWSFTHMTISDSLNTSKEYPGQLNHYILGFGQDHMGEVYVTTTDSSGPRGKSGKVFRIVPSQFPTAVANNSAIPTDYKVYPAYPNPFNPATTIRYYLPKNSQVKLDIFDLMGQKISTLVNTVQTQGIHEARFNASALSSGVYFYKFESNNKVLTGKLILMK